MIVSGNWCRRFERCETQSCETAKAGKGWAYITSCFFLFGYVTLTLLQGSLSLRKKETQLSGNGIIDLAVAAKEWRILVSLSLGFVQNLPSPAWKTMAPCFAWQKQYK